MKDQIKQQVDVVVRMSFEVDADIEKDVVESRLQHWISETMALMDDKEEQYEFISTKMLYTMEEAEIYNPGERPKRGNHYIALGKGLPEALRQGNIASAVHLLNNHQGILCQFDGKELIILLDFVQKWYTDHKITEADYFILGGE